MWGIFLFQYLISKKTKIKCKIYKQAVRQNFSIHPPPFIIAWNLK